MDNIAVLILAAGKSSRMKSIKQLEKINNKTLLEIVLEKTQSFFIENIFCVLGANSDTIKNEIDVKNVEFIENINFEAGLSSSIVAGLYHLKNNNLQFDGVCILLADQPAIENKYLQNLYNLFSKNSSKIIASNYGGVLGVPAVFPKQYFPELLKIQGDKGAKEFINSKKNEVLTPQRSSNFTDIDTKDDLLKFKKTLEKN